MIRTAVREGRYSDPQAETLIARVLIERKRKVVEAFLPAVNPLIDFTLSAGGRLTFRNAAVDAGVAPAPEQGYRASWARFDNLTGESGPLGADTQTREVSMDAPVSLPSAPGAFVRVLVSAVEPAPLAWTTPVSVYFRRAASGWTLVGLERN
jgi:hypothetical protein